MSEPFSDREKSRMGLVVHSSRPSMPFIEEDSEIKSEVKTEDSERQSPLFEPQDVLKRSIEDEPLEVKRPKLSTDSGPLAYGGGPARPYVLGRPYNYSRHEIVPQLEVNSQHHKMAIEHFLFNVKEVVLPALSPYRDEDKSINDTFMWFENGKNLNIPAIPPTSFAFSGNSGSGKTSTLNNVLGMSGLANADAAMESVTQNPQLFNHGNRQQTMFVVEVLFLNARAIESLIKRCVTDLVIYVRSMSDDEAEEENDYIRDSAESSRQVFDDLFSHQDGLKSLDDVEDFLETKTLLSHENEPISESAVDRLYQQIKDRASSEGINLDSRALKLTAGNVGELRAKTATFSERGAFAPLISSIRTKFHSPLLAMGIELADLPGYTDTNIHLRKTSMAYSVNCPKAIFVADLSRCLTTPELKRSLKETIKLKGAENVCLVLRGKEVVEKTKSSKWNKVESTHLETLERSLENANFQLNGNDDQSITAQVTADIQTIERQILEHKIAVRDRIITDHFSQKEYQNKHNAGKIRVITVANKCHEYYMAGSQSHKAVLSFDKTGIQELRAYMCETPSRDRVRAFARHSANCITKIRRVAIWADGPKMPPRDAAMALFEQHARWGVEGDRVLLVKSSTQYKKLLNTRFSSTWADAAQKTMDAWTAKYAARTQGVFIRQGGRHSPVLRGMKTKKPQLVSWVEDLLLVVEDDIFNLLKSTWDVINEVDGSICENISNVVEKIRHGLEIQDEIGGANLEGVFELFEEERKFCIRDIRDGIIELKTNLRRVPCILVTLSYSNTDMNRSTAMKSIADEPCDEDSPVFVREMFKIFTTTFTKFPPKTKNVTKERMKCIREQVLSGKGPYNMMTNEISAQMVPVINSWADKATTRIETMHADLRDVLFKSFEGKKMSDPRREQIGPSIEAAMTKARAILQADLDGYPADII
ncbi:unnamed protein product [Aureobasidium uvarum]|uniref:Uncharacterized protein n=1 Tax=Aureobasidium uvarum TaxID=2773716 RepID=A0A9N8PVJ1_9PEZI|nr:unnamed protein product [Aureobasidium uvarum]